MISSTAATFGCGISIPVIRARSSIRPRLWSTAARFVNYRPKTVTSLLGPIRLRRAYYHCKHCSHGEVPWDQRLGLNARKLTAAAEEIAALAGTLTDFEEASQWSIQRMCGMRLSESTVERVTEEAGTRLKQLLDDGHTIGNGVRYTWHRDQRGQTCAYVSLDATGVRQQGAGGALAEGRMAYVGKLYNPVAGDRGKSSKPQPARYLAAICDLAKIGLLLRRQATAVGFDDAQQQIAISDGGTGLEEVFRQRFPRAEIILDFWHAREHLVKLAGEIFPADEGGRAAWIEARSHQLRHEGGRSVLNTLEEMDLSRVSAAARQSHREHVGYFRNHAHKMDYPRYRACGWQIGSGPVEAACKTVVGRRLKQSGMRWGLAAADAVCHLRALHQSEPHRWQVFWRNYRQHHLQT